MANLMAKSPCEGLLPVEFDGVVLRELSMATVTSITPFKGQEKKSSKALEAALGLLMPKANWAAENEGARAIWFGQGRILLIGADAPEALNGCAAMTDQSDAWIMIQLEGPASRDVLARLVPIDFRRSAFELEQTARTMLQHMSVSITRVGDDAFQIMAFRSMAATCVHELEIAMKVVAARDTY
ncbi:sarcosine oxidase subunit gamma [Pseudopelagicola sp. nBUS_20]|uniref:sarcosine oxidase subunit gamma n=1 Tax=Pseudopelagicola sp. nBUS_20 TaxID=3395317 RepID=UPI003EBE58C4